MADKGRIPKRSMATNLVPEGDGADRSGPTGDGNAYAGSVTSSRRSRNSTRSSQAARASESRLQASQEVMELERKLNGIVREIQITEIILEEKEEEIEAAKTQIQASTDVNTDLHRTLVQLLKKDEGEREKLKKKLRLLKIDETFAECDLKAAQRHTKVAEEHTQMLLNEEEDEDSDYQQQVSDDDELNFEDTKSRQSDESDMRKLQLRLEDLRGYKPGEVITLESETDSSPVLLPPIKTTTPKVGLIPEESPKAPEEPKTETPMEQLAAALCKVIGQSPTPSSSSDSTTKMLARQAMKTDLSPFDGSAAEWPVFRQQFDTVSAACGLSNVENLQRLQRALRGSAREAVRALLMNPDNVPRIMTVLEKRFGNAECIIEELESQVKKIQNVKDNDFGSLLQLVDSVRNLTETAVSMKCQPYLSNPQLINCLISKLPASLQMEWGRKRSELGKAYPDLQDLANWMDIVGDSIVHLYRPQPQQDQTCKGQQQKKGQQFSTAKPQKSFAVAEDKKKNCRICDVEEHHPSKCPVFLKMNVQDRWTWVRKNKCCFSCLYYGHSTADCRHKRSCAAEGCDKTHHLLLHMDPKPKANEDQIENVRTSTHAVMSSRVNLNILPVLLQGPRGRVETYAMLDPGADFTTIDEDIADKLGLRGPIKPLTHSGLHEAIHVPKSRSVTVTIIGEDGVPHVLNPVRTVPNLPLPRQSVRRSMLNKWKHLSRLPIRLYEDAKPTILIGIDHPKICNTSELVLGPGNAPIGGRSVLGWALLGRDTITSQQQRSMFHLRETEDDLHQLVKYHFSTEAFGSKPDVEKPRSREDARAMQIMDGTLTRVGAWWECGLLWKEDTPEIPKYSKESATKRLMSMERKMDSSPEFAEAYQEKIETYLKKGYAKKLTDTEAQQANEKTYYLPHFMAVNPKKQNKLRFVFDAAAKTSGKSLNDLLLPGPDQLKPLPSILFKFRQKKIAITADVRDMFHRVGVRPEDKDAQRFLWRGMDRSKPPDVYRMEVLIFGATCSPAIAQEVKNRNAREVASNQSEIIKAVTDNFYVDDYLDSWDTVEKALQIREDIQEVMNKGNFHLCGWSSNSKEFMEGVPEELRAEKGTALELGDGITHERVLGMFWNAKEDIFTFSLRFLRTKEDLLDGDRLPTKRELLALAMSIYDPLGLMSILTIRAKMLLQYTWRSKIGWDDDLPSSASEKWENWLNALKRIPEFKVRRCYSDCLGRQPTITLHTFVDASEQAFGAVSYFVVDSDLGKEVILIGSKARVAPLKPLSIPRMELQAAVLGARFANFIKEEHTVPVTRTVYWSDSSTVLGWLVGDGRKFLQFVAHRIGEIQEITNPLEWRWVPTKLNVADELTRDVGEVDFSAESRWINGPEFLKQEEEHWPIAPKFAEPKEELKREFCGALKMVSIDRPIDSTEFSSWMKLIRVTARVLLYVLRLKKQEVPKFLRPEDIRRAEIVWWRWVQHESFPEEICALMSETKQPRNSRLRHLNLVLDEEGILRVDGRLKNAEVDSYVKSPVILCHQNHYTKLLIQYFHDRAGHHGQELVANELKQRFYITHLRAAIRSCWNACQKCKNERAQPQPPLMGQLPAFRVLPSKHPFANTGVDYFGPMTVTIGRRHEKRWGVLFTCLSTRSVHLEIAASLSTDSCIMAIRRFVGRRGNPETIHSDNGTNFHGACNEMKKSLEELDQEKLNNECLKRGIKWHFNPPSAPHMGGSWERLVRSVKVALNATLNDISPKEEVLQTLFVEAEHTVNSHPLTHVPLDSYDSEALTPNHFLIGRSSNSAPPGVFGAEDVDLRKVWRRSQRLADLFWSRWVKEYLPTLQRRTKWLKVTRPLKIGDLVVEADPTKTRNSWPKGIVEAVYPGRDGIVRVVDIRTSTGTYRRPVAKLALLDVCRGEAAPLMTNDVQESLVSGRMSPRQEQ